MTKTDRDLVGIEQLLAIVLDRINAAAAQAKILKRSLKAREIDHGFKVALEVEPLIREANYALQAASLLQRERRSR